MTRYFVLLFLLVANFLFVPRPASALPITIPTVLVGNPGNPYDPFTAREVGGVAKYYRIGTTEVTNAQYAAFLNAKADSDPLELYNTNMGSDIYGGIARSGMSGSYTYATKTNMADKPVNYVSWYDSVRFVNWLNNGQGAGDTETGAYTLLGGTPIPSQDDSSITRNSGASWFLPSESEWYKAAYYQPAAQVGDVDNYWLYPTASNSTPTVAIINAVGDISNPGANVACYNHPFDGSNFTTVGSAGPLSRSFYGTYDQGGNVFEWDERRPFTNERCILGGCLLFDASSMKSSAFNFDSPTTEIYAYGFRVASVPEPSTAILAIVGCAMMWVLRKRFK